MPNIEGRRCSTRWAAALAAAVLLAACAACSGRARPDPAADGRLTVVTTFTVLADMVDNVAGGRVEVESLIRPGTEIHSYRPAPEDLVRVRSADLLVRNGLGLEGWFTRFTDGLDAPTATLSAGVATIPISAGGYHGRPNPHAWMSPDNALVYVDNIARALGELDPADAAAYRARAADYQRRIEHIGARLEKELAEVPRTRRALVTCEGAFSYLARDAGLKERYLWPVNADTQPSAGRIAEVVEFVRAADVPTVFCETTVNDGTQRQVARESGARLGAALYVDSLSVPTGPVPTYLDLLRHDTEAIAAGLTRQEDP